MKLVDAVKMKDDDEKLNKFIDIYKSIPHMSNRECIRKICELSKVSFSDDICIFWKGVDFWLKNLLL